MINIRLENLGVGYDKKVVVSDINLEIKKGELVCLLGPNGSGKTTILRTIASFLKKIEGFVYINDEEVANIKKKVLSKTLSVVLTERLQIGMLTARQIVEMGRHPHTGIIGNMTIKDIRIVTESLEMVDAIELSNRYYSELSDGEKQKVLIARALCQEPQIILLDEPTTHLDVRHKLELMNIIKKLSREKGITVIYSLHEVELATKSADLLLLIKDGAVLKKGRPEEIVDDNLINFLYGIKNAGYNSKLGTIEIANMTDIKSEIFILAGGSTGIDIYRGFAKEGIAFSSGIIQQNDLDYHIAKTMGADIISIKPFSKISEKEIFEAKKFIDKSKILVVSDYINTNHFEKYFDLVSYAIEKEKKVYSYKCKDSLAIGKNVIKYVTSHKEINPFTKI